MFHKSVYLLCIFLLALFIEIPLEYVDYIEIGIYYMTT